jgi:hypothetical protein
MNRQIRAIRLLLLLFLPAFVAPGFAVRQTSKLSEEERDFMKFTDRVQAYVQMQKEQEAQLMSLKPTKDSAQIIEHQHALARKIADARRNARQGDIFVPEAAKRLRKIIRSSFHGPEGRLARQTIREADPSMVIARLHVNDIFPEGFPLTTMPPALLIKLPELPQELAFRFVGRDLTLIDTKARLIVDLISNAIP